jgi:hypothetical protein
VRTLFDDGVRSGVAQVGSPDELMFASPTRPDGRMGLW